MAEPYIDAEHEAYTATYNKIVALLRGLDRSMLFGLMDENVARSRVI
jgi:hypothetical protein